MMTLRELLENYNYQPTDHGLNRITEGSTNAKADLISHLQNHPYWDEEQKAIILKAEFSRGLDLKGVQNFVSWLNSIFFDGDGETFVKLLGAVSLNTTQFITETSLPLFANIHPDIKVNVGMKVSRVVNKLCGKLGLTSQPDYNREFAKFADAINPLTYTTYTILSVNEKDFLTMSFGRNWSSCHTIDKQNLRGVGSNTHGGCYSAGTLSYALDSTTVILYTVDERYDNPAEMWRADKVKRCNFHIREDGMVLVQGRVYPDGRDGGDNSLAGQFRAIVQKIVADCWGLPNYWSAKQTAKDWCMTAEGASNYEDYFSYSDCNVTLNKEKPLDDTREVLIGHEPICISCGYAYYGEDSHDWIYCEDCNPNKRCERCGNNIDFGDEYYVDYVDEDRYYCSCGCAERDGLHWLSDVGAYTSGDYYYDYYDECYYSDIEVEAEDGNTFHTEDNARLSGYIPALNEEGYEVWIREDYTYVHSDGAVYTYEEEVVVC